MQFKNSRHRLKFQKGKFYGDNKTTISISIQLNSIKHTITIYWWKNGKNWRDGWSVPDVGMIIEWMLSSVEMTCN